MSINVILECQSKPESIDDLKATFRNILPDTRDYAGCIKVKVIVNLDDPFNIVLFETWETRDHYEAYFTWRSESGALSGLGEMLSQSLSIRFYQSQDI